MSSSVAYILCSETLRSAGFFLIKKRDMITRTAQQIDSIYIILGTLPAYTLS
jgi:hypothetical protein